MGEQLHRLLQSKAVLPVQFLRFDYAYVLCGSFNTEFSLERIRSQLHRRLVSGRRYSCSIALRCLPRLLVHIGRFLRLGSNHPEQNDYHRQN